MITREDVDDLRTEIAAWHRSADEQMQEQRAYMAQHGLPLLDQTLADPIDAVLVRRGAIAVQPVRRKESAEHGVLLLGAGIAVNEGGIMESRPTTAVARTR